MFSCLLTVFTLSAADFNDGFFYYNIIDEAAKTAEVAPKPDGAYYFPNSFKSIEGSVNGYTIVAVGEYAFKDANGSYGGNYPMVWSYAPEIKANAFDNCHINFFGLQGPVTTVHPESFKNNKLGYIRCNSASFTNKVGGTEIGALWTPDNSRLIAVPGEWRQGFSSTAASRTNYTLPAATTTIGAYAFYGNTVLNTLNLGSVQVIESEALANMTALRTLTIPATATTIAADAFLGTTGITSLTVNLAEPVAGVVFDDAVYNALRDKVNFGANSNVAAFQSDPDWGKFFTKAADDVFILGEVNFNSWSPNNGVQMAYDQNNDVYHATVYTAGTNDGYSYFSFTKALADNWDAIAGSRIGAVSNGDFLVTEEQLGHPLSLQTGSTAFKIPEGKWNLTLSLTDMTLTINEVTRNVWVLGDVNNNSWAANAGLPMTYDAQTGTYTVSFKAKGQNDGYSFFNFTTELAAAADGWNDIANYRIGAVSNGDFLVTEQWLDQELSLTHGTNAYKIPAGNYTLTLDLKNYKLTISVAPFDATPFKSGAYYFRPISDSEVEFIHPSEYDATLGPYSGVTDTSAPATVTNNDVTYTVTTIGAGAFKDATITGSMETVRMIWFDAATTTVKADAFNNWTINAVGLRATDIDPTAFRNNHINRINTNSQNVFYVSSDNSGNHGSAMTGDLYKLVDGKKILWAWGGDRKVGLWTTENQTLTTNYTFSAYDEIGDYALYGNQRLQEVTIQNATKIGKESMAYMTALRTLTLPAQLTEIGQDAFKGVTTITSLTVNAATPPTGGVFETDVYEACKDRLVVPEGSEAAYRADANWGKFFSAAPETYAVTIAEGIEHGTVEADKTEAQEGETVTLTVTPDEGYELDALEVIAGADTPVETTLNTETGKYTFNMPAANVTVNATFGPVPVVLDGVVFAADTYASWFGDTDMALPEGVTAYAVTGIEDDKVLMEALAYIPANVGVLLYSTTPAETVSARPYTGETATVASMLQGGLEEMAITDGYVLYGDEFVRTLGGTLAAHRCYLPMPTNASGAPRLRIILNDEIVTAVADIEAAQSGKVIYVDPMGRVSERPFNGFNIVVNGNKVTKMVK